MLRTWREQQAKERKVNAGYKASGDVFTREDGAPHVPHQLSRWWGEAAKAAGVPPIRFHDARHTHASLGIGAASLTVVSERLGHSTIKITADLYQHSDIDADRAAADAIAAKLRGLRETPVVEDEYDSN